MDWSRLYLFCINLSWGIDTSISVTFLAPRANQMRPFRKSVSVYDVQVMVVDYTSRAIVVSWRMAPARLNPTTSVIFAKSTDKETKGPAYRGVKSARVVLQRREVVNIYLDAVLYEVWYWPKIGTPDIRKKSTGLDRIRIDHLLPGALYCIGLSLLANNRSRDLIVIEQRTSILLLLLLFYYYCYYLHNVLCNFPGGDLNRNNGHIQV